MTRQRFSCIDFDDLSQEKSVRGREHIRRLEAFVLSSLEVSRERSLALTKLEEAHFWINASIAADQLDRESGQNTE